MDVAKQQAERLAVLDVIRGWAVLWILLANIGYFALPTAAEAYSGPAPAVSSGDAWTQALILAFAVGKARSSLAILFGAGLWLQFQKRRSVGTWPLSYVRRSIVLVAIGLLHATLVWNGDILVVYGLVAIAATFVVGMPAKTRQFMAISLALLGAIGGWIASIPKISAVPPDLTIALEKWVFQHGSYFEQLSFRLATYWPMLGYFVIYGLVGILPLFVVGIRYAETGFLVAPSKFPKTVRTTLMLGLGAGIPLNLASLLLIPGRHIIDREEIWETISGPILAIGLVTLWALIVEGKSIPKATSILSRVGKVALTTYLTQSVLCSFIFYSFGGGLFGRLNWPQLMGVVFAVWTVNIALAMLWTRLFELGPVEWLLRSASEGRCLKLRKMKE